MSDFGKKVVVRKVVSYTGTNYVTAKGLAKVLAREATNRLLFSSTAFENRSKYGRYSGLSEYRDLMVLWRKHESRLRKGFYKRILPLVKPLFEEVQ